jgi:hypothetical protein
MQRFKKAFVESYVAAITVGWIFAEAVVHFASMLAAPYAQWAARREYSKFANLSSMTTSFRVQDALPDLIRCIALLLVGYVLLRWLYYAPTYPEDKKPTSIE